MLLGTPAEEGGGGKIAMIEAGVFDGIDAAMMFHPFDRDLLAHTALASLWLTFDFEGVPSHAAIAPHAGRSALTACLDTFRLVDGQRVHFRDGVRVHGFVTDGGQAVNIIPERAACEFSVRALDGDGARARPRRSSSGAPAAAAMASDVKVDIRVRRGLPRHGEQHGPRPPLRRATSRRSGVPRASATTRVGAGSTDMGDVSHVVPAIHPWLAIVDEGAALCHEHRFAEAAAHATARRAPRSSPPRPSLAPRSSSSPTPRCAQAVSAEWESARATVTSICNRAAWCIMSCTIALPFGHLGQALEAPVVEVEARRGRRRDEARDLRPAPALRARDAEGQEVARLDPVVGDDDAAHVGAEHRREGADEQDDGDDADRQRPDPVALDRPDEELRARRRVVRVGRHDAEDDRRGEVDRRRDARRAAGGPNLVFSPADGGS